MLDRALDAIPAPVVPAGLAARIARDVPQMAQLPPLADAPAIGTAAPATVAALNGQAARHRLPAWLTIGTGGFGALAAGLAVLALLGPGAQQQPDTVVAAVPGTAPAPMLAAAPMPTAATPPAPQGATPAPTRLAAAPRVTTRPGTAAVAEPATTPTLPKSTAVPPVSELADAMPPAPEADPQSPDAPAAPALGTRGQMGPVLPQGYGYSGGGGPSVPSGAPVRMSGGPGPGQGGPPPR